MEPGNLQRLCPRDLAKRDLNPRARVFQSGFDAGAREGVGRGEVAK
jgi:hypothetical protein